MTLRLKSESDWFVFGEIFVRQDYDSALRRVLTDPKVAEVATVLDLGANTGLFALRCLDMATCLDKKVGLLAIEGCPPTFTTLRANLRPHSKARAFHGLVGQLSGSARIYASRVAFTNRIVADGEKSSAFPFLNRSAFSVPYIDLDALCPCSIDLVKCDIEGAELEFVKNYERLLRSTKFLIIEFHSRECDVPLAKTLLNQYGFTQERLPRQDDSVSLELYCRRN